MKKELSKKLVAYSSMTVAALLAVKNSDAQIIYTNPPDIHLSGVGDQAVLDLNNDGTYDVKVRIFDSYTAQSYPSSPGFGVLISNVNTYVNPVEGLMYTDCRGSFFYGYGILPRKNGQMIAENPPFGQYWYTIQYGEVLNWDYYGGTCHRWADTKKHFAGFRMRVSGSNFRYGWIRLSVNHSGSKATVYDWAINSQVNQPIAAGQTMKLGEQLQPSSGLQIYSYGKEIIVNQNSQNTPLDISIFNLLGEEVKQVNSSDEIIRMNTTLEPGIYIVKVRSPNEMTSRQVVIE